MGILSKIEAGPRASLGQPVAGKKNGCRLAAMARGGFRVAAKVSRRKFRGESFAAKVVNPGRLVPGTARIELSIPSNS